MQIFLNRVLTYFYQYVILQVQQGKPSCSTAGGKEARMEKHDASDTAKIIIKATVTTTVKIEVIRAASQKKSACNCCSNCKR